MNILEWAETFDTTEKKDSSFPMTQTGEESRLTHSNEEEHQYNCTEEEDQGENYKAIHGKLKRHIRSNQEGVKYKCLHCSYKATQKGILMSHIEALHEGVK